MRERFLDLLIDTTANHLHNLNPPFPNDPLLIFMLAIKYK